MHVILLQYFFREKHPIKIEGYSLYFTVDICSIIVRYNVYTLKDTVKASNNAYHSFKNSIAITIFA